MATCGTCDKKFSHGSSLSRHYKEHPGHKLNNESKQISAEQAASLLLNNQTQMRRHARLKKVIEICETEEVVNIFLPALANNPQVTVADFLKSKSKQSRPPKVSPQELLSQLRSLLTTIFTEYPDHNMALTRVLQSTMQLSPLYHIHRVLPATKNTTLTCQC